jgi:hypothetical protein
MCVSSTQPQESKCLALKTGLHRFYRKPKKPIGFGIKIKFWNVRKNQKPSEISGLSIRFFGLSNGFWLIFYLKFKFWMKIVNRSIFRFIARFFWISFFKISQKFKKFKSNRPVFGELIKQVLSVFIKTEWFFHRYCNSWFMVLVNNDMDVEGN